MSASAEPAIASCPCWGHGAPRVAGYRPGWPERSGPQAAINKRDGDRFPQRPAWVDHSYRYKSPHNGETVFVAEPYHLDAEALNESRVFCSAGLDRLCRRSPGAAPSDDDPGGNKAWAAPFGMKLTWEMESVLEHVAIHEAGHAVVAIRVGLRVNELCIANRGDPASSHATSHAATSGFARPRRYRGFVERHGVFRSRDDASIAREHARKLAEAHATVAYAGALAELLYLGGMWEGTDNTDRAGAAEDLAPFCTPRRPLADYCSRMSARASDLLHVDRTEAAVRVLAAELELRDLTGDEVLAIVGSAQKNEPK